MAKGFRPPLVPPSHRRVDTESRRPVLCLGLTLGVTLLVFTIFGMSAWNVYEHRFSNNSLTLQTSDEVSIKEVSSDLSAIFCHAYKVTSRAPVTLYFLSQHAEVNTTDKDVVAISIHQLPGREYSYRSFYMLDSSAINVYACGKEDFYGKGGSESEIVFLQGSDNFRQWRKSRFCRDCTRKRVSIPKCGDHHDDRRMGWLNDTVTVNDYYFFIVYYGRTHKHDSDLGIFVNGSLTRTHFDTRYAENKCHSGAFFICQFELPWLSNKDLVMRFDEFKDRFEETLVYTQCQIRLVLWICLFGVLPVICIILITIIFGCFLCRKRERSFTTVKQQAVSKKGRRQDKDGLVDREVVQGQEEDGMTIQDQ
ncbi:unnamed protein product [Lymnaea stagnalis]|uniref:E3 ubiquitin-protein ligase APD1-4 middle domain-containing protein n=1 Tax=Lymnaea stagnalis TaxID=6523 RepID=A0AAV2H3V8_LYMST